MRRLSPLLLLLLLLSACGHAPKKIGLKGIRPSQLLKAAELLPSDIQIQFEEQLAAVKWTTTHIQLPDQKHLEKYLLARIELAHALVHRFRIDQQIAASQNQSSLELQKHLKLGIAYCDWLTQEHGVDSEIDRLNGELRLLNIWGWGSSMVRGVAAITPLYRALQLDPNNYLIQLSWAKRYLYAPTGFGRDASTALQYAQKAQRLQPKAPQPLIYICLSLWELGRLNEARETLRTLKKRFPKHQWAGLIQQKFSR